MLKFRDINPFILTIYIVNTVFHSLRNRKPLFYCFCLKADVKIDKVDLFQKRLLSKTNKERMGTELLLQCVSSQALTTEGAINSSHCVAPATQGSFIHCASCYVQPTF